MLIIFTVSAFITVLEAQDTEENSSPIQEFIRKAEQHVKLNQIEEAVVLYERIVIAAPDDVDSRLELATLYSRINQHEKAAQTYSKLLETDSENLEYQDALVSSLQAAGKIREALNLALEYIQTYPEKGVHYARIAKLYETEGDEEEAITNYNKAIQLGYENIQTYLSLARLNFLNADMGAAEIALKNAILNSTSDSEWKTLERQLFNFYRFNGNFEQKMQKAEEDGTITIGLQKLLAEHYHKIGELEKSVNTYEKVREMITNSYEQQEISDELLKVYVELGDMDSAYEPYQTLENSDADSTTISYTLDQNTATFSAIYIVETSRDTLFSAFKRYDKLDVLKTHLEGKLAENKENSVALTILARIYWHEKDYQKAAEMYEALGKTDTKNLRYLYYAASALRKSDQPELTNAMLNHAADALATSSEKDDAYFLGALATICNEKRMYEPAIALTKAALDMSDIGKDSMIQDTLNAILARSYRETKQYAEALRLYQEIASYAGSGSLRRRANKAIPEIVKEGGLYEKWIAKQFNDVEKNPNNLKLILKLARSYEDTDKIQEAITQYEKLTKLDPDNAYWYSKLGDLYQRVDRKVEEVVESMALSLDGDGSYVEIDDSWTINSISEEFTISAWIKPTDFPNTCTTIFFKGNKRMPDITHRQFTFWLFDEGCVFFDTSPGGRPLRYTVSESESIIRNKWYHVAGTIDAKNDTMKLYINGSVVNSNNFKGENNLPNTTLPFRIGCSHEEERTEHASFAGLIDEVRIWNIARTENQIRADMHKELNGDEAGLVAYWKFETENDGRISDSSPNKNDGQLIRDAKLVVYTRPTLTTLKTEYYSKAVSYYEKAIELQPNTLQYYVQLANLFIDHNQISDAASVYLRGLDALFKQSSRDSLIRAMSDLYLDVGKEDKLIAILEEVKPKMQKSEVLYELLGDLYSKTDNPEKAEIAYTEWLKIRLSKENIQSAHEQRAIAEDLLEKELYPEMVLKHARHAMCVAKDSSFHYPMTLANAYIANERYEDALRYYIYTLSILSTDSSFEYFWNQMVDASKNAKDKNRYDQMLDALINSIPPEYVSSRVKVK